MKDGNLTRGAGPVKEHCPDCGTPVEGGRAGCQSLLDELTALAYASPQFAAVHSLAFDAYCMQHPDRYCRSAKSYAAHLTRLCCGLEYDGRPDVYRAIQKWLNGNVEIEKPDALEKHGRMTIAEVLAYAGPQERIAAVHAWAGDVWRAHAHQHDLARRWIREALAMARQ